MMHFVCWGLMALVGVVYQREVISLIEQHRLENLKLGERFNGSGESNKGAKSALGTAGIVYEEGIDRNTA